MVVLTIQTGISAITAFLNNSTFFYLILFPVVYTIIRTPRTDNSELGLYYYCQTPLILFATLFHSLIPLLVLTTAFQLYDILILTNPSNPRLCLLYTSSNLPPRLQHIDANNIQQQSYGAHHEPTTIAINVGATVFHGRWMERQCIFERNTEKSTTQERFIGKQCRLCRGAPISIEPEHFIPSHRHIRLDFSYKLRV